jgi:ArsR family transcriptional regulator, arsenate/arsenite/antimonite-responsive transcriptional repressor
VPRDLREQSIQPSNITAAGETLIAEMSTTRAPLPVIAEPRLDLVAPDVTDAQVIAGLLADRVRASILRMLADGPHCVCEMATALGERENNVSNHLAKLRDAGLVHSVRHATNGRFLYYERDAEAVARARRALDEVLS